MNNTEENNREKKNPWMKMKITISEDAVGKATESTG